MREGIGGVERDDLRKHFDGASVLPRALQLRGDLVVRGERVAHQAELGIQLGELRRDVPVAIGEIRGRASDDLANLFVDSDCFQREALRGVVLADALVGGDRLAMRFHLRLQVTDLQQRPGVVRILLNQSSDTPQPPCRIFSSE